MPSAPTHHPPPFPAPCRFARGLLMLCALTSLLFVLVTGICLTTGRPRPADDPSVVWMHAFALSRPALWPAGSPARHPETRHPGIDLRIAAGLEKAP